MSKLVSILVYSSITKKGGDDGVVILLLIPKFNFSILEKTYPS